MKEYKVEEEWKGMPEYNNNKTEDPVIVATFKFRTKRDFEEFNNYLRHNLYNGQKVFDGMQKKDKKSTWFPPNEKASKYRYV